MKNILNSFTKRSLKLNIKRTIATCIGIILSTALICAVAGVFSSFQQTIIKYAKDEYGDYHAVFNNVPKEEQKYILENREVESAFITQGVGYAKLENCTNKYKPYVYLIEYDNTALNNYGLELEKGRMPENSNELVISSHIKNNGGVTFEIGEKITLDLAKRMCGLEELNQNNPFKTTEGGKNHEEEQLVSIEEKREFTIVGIINRPQRNIESYEAPGYTVITKLEKIRDNANIAVKYKNVKETYKITEKIGEMHKGRNTEAEYNYKFNSDLLRWHGVARTDDTMNMLYSLAGIVIGIIIISSIFVIRNSFAISITEKIKQYGMLSSIGATKKQIKRNVLYEGMILGVISIPIGILGGVLATFILMQISTVLIGDYVFTNSIEFVFSMPIISIVISILLGFLTIYLSCIFSARKASKISPIDAIRSNENIKIKAKKVKSPKIIKKIFGTGGDIAYKNLKRNRKKYRTTVVSLVVSITIFIALSTFMNYTFDITGTIYEEADYNISISIYDDTKEDSSKQTYEYFQNIVKEHQLDDYSISRVLYLDADLKDYMTEEYKEYATYETEEGAKASITICAVGKEKYNEYLKKIGAKYEDCKDGIIYYDNSISYNDNNERLQVMNIKVGDEIKGITQNGKKPINLKIMKIADEGSMDRTWTPYGTYIVSDELIERIGEYSCTRMKINSKNADELCSEIEKEAEERKVDLSLTNYQKEAEQQNKMVLLISIFLYGFITVIALIGVTNIFNTITTNMNLRSKEFAMLKSVGMTKKEFNKMIRLESIFYGVKSLIIGITLGLGISYWIYKVVIGAEFTSGLPFVFPTGAVIISIIFITIIVGIIMKYSLSKINKQNIITTIRNDNI
ncbi:MAG: ABC transporter permease [Clostridia bacterium]|nr:ABC transporter permease [Clostridia bacterium]